MNTYLRALRAGLVLSTHKIRKWEKKAHARATEARSANNSSAEEKIEYTRRNLHRLRTKELRRAARAANLAYGFARGLTWQQVENINRTDRSAPDWDRIQKLIEINLRQDMRILGQKLEEWRQSNCPEIRSGTKRHNGGVAQR